MVVGREERPRSDVRDRGYLGGIADAGECAGPVMLAARSLLFVMVLPMGAPVMGMRAFIRLGHHSHIGAMDDREWLAACRHEAERHQQPRRQRERGEPDSQLLPCSSAEDMVAAHFTAPIGGAAPPLNGARARIGKKSGRNHARGIAGCPEPGPTCTCASQDRLESLENGEESS